MYYVSSKTNLYNKRALKELDKHLVTPSKKWKPEYGDLPERQYKETRLGIKLGEPYKTYTYDIHIANDTNLYLLANEGLITHNSGKSSTIGAGLALYFATERSYEYLQMLGTSPFATIPIISPTREQANEVYSAIKNFILKSPYLFNQYLDGKIESFQDMYSEDAVGKANAMTGAQIRLNNKVVIKTLTADVSRIRGFAAPFYILDECAWFGAESNDNKNTDKAIEEAIQPATAQFGDYAFGLKISSPNGESGLMYEAKLKEEHPQVLHSQVETWHCNPIISKSYLEAQKLKGQTYFDREYGAKYTASEQSYLDPERIEASVIKGLEKADPLKEYRYVAAMDYATKSDYWTLAIGHKEYNLDPDTKEKMEYIYIDCLMHWKGKQGDELDPSEIIPEICTYLKEYRVSYCLSDHYAYAALRSMFQREGCVLKEFKVSAQSKLKYMYSLNISINSNALRMVNNQLAVKHLKDLREKRSSTGKLKVEHAANAHDDYADSIGLVVYQFDKNSPVYAGFHKEEEGEAPPQTKDARGNFIAMPTAQDLAEKAGVPNFTDNRFEIEQRLKKERGEVTEEDEDDDGDFWFSM